MFLLMLLTPRAGTDAMALFEAMDGMGTDERIVSEILSLRSNAELSTLKQEFQEKYEVSLMDMVDDELSGDLKKLMMTLLQCNRAETEEPDRQKAKEQAETLKRAAKGWGTDEDMITGDFGTRSQLTLACDIFV